MTAAPSALAPLPTPTDLTTDPSPTVTEGADLYGPLAVLEHTGGMEALAHGQLEVTGDCVMLRTSGHRTLLLWPADRTRWSHGEAAVLFTEGGRPSWTMRSGDQVTFGGGGVPLNEQHLRTLGWINRPNWACLTPIVWLIGTVEKVSPAPTP
jgi:hypothetical protein